MTTPSFGSELRRRRLEAGLSLDALRRRAYLSKGYLSKIEHGRQPSPEAARMLDAALRADGALLELRTAPVPRVQLPAVEPTPAIGWTLTLAADDGGAFLPVAVAGGAPAADVAMLAQRLFGHGVRAAGRADHALLHFGDQFDRMRGFGRTASPSLVLPTLVTQLDGVRGVARHAESELRTPLLRLAARYAEFAGWMTQEAGDLKAAAWWTAYALAHATEAGDDQLATFLLFRQAELAYDAHDLATTLELTRRVQDTRGAAARVRALAAQREAHALARKLDATGALSALDRSRELFTRAADEAREPIEPILGGTSTADPAAMALGWCLFDLRRTREAAAVFDEHVEAIPATSLRARTLYGMRRAAAHAAAGEIDHACDLALALLGDADLVDSAGVRAEMRSLCAELRVHHTNPRAQAAHRHLVEISGNR